MSDYFYKLAQLAADIAGEPIKPEWIYCQWQHETGGFDSALAKEYHNLGGLTQSEPNDTPQPDGDYYYMQFGSFEDYARYFGKYLTLYEENGIYNSQTIDDYIIALKAGGYFGDSLENYLSSVKKIYAENFGVA